MVKFTAWGHKNILCEHDNTLEFTKEKEMSMRASCIVGVKADFNKDEIKEFIKGKEKVRMVITAGDLKDECEFVPNPDFDSDTEIVVRKTEFNSPRTLGFRVDKASADFIFELKQKLNDPEQEIEVELL